MKRTIRIGTRDSALAMLQARKAAAALEAIDGDIGIEIIPMRVTGDWDPRAGESRLCEAEGGKGLFVKDIEQALLGRRIDLAVHSMKDVPSFLPKGLVIEHMLKREDPRDAFLSNDGNTLADLPEGATVGTSSLRRQAFSLAVRPDLNVVPFRGNVPTRIKKLREGLVDATFLAVAGLNRLDLAGEIASIMPPEMMLPSAGQGAIGLQTRDDQTELHDLMRELHCLSTGLSVAAERAALQTLDGSCHTPIGAYATYDDSFVYLRVAVASQDGRRVFSRDEKALVTDIKESEALGRKVGGLLLGVLPEGILCQ
ncbi:MAG: hydroxymethylbilane synthase [Alphaproteobacteria bacterium]|nr:hydroxymethylbilane synthase [Alphaproteobacteria bacterium]